MTQMRQRSLTMDFFSLTKPIIHSIDPERAHHIAIGALKKNLIPSPNHFTDNRLSIKIWNKSFTHPVGLAAGFDKNGDAIPALCKQGFSFIAAFFPDKVPKFSNKFFYSVLISI